MGDNGMSVTPVMNVGGNDNTFGSGMGGGWIWILLIFMLLGGNGLGFGNGAAANNATNLINNDFLYTQQKVDSLSQALISQTNQLNQSLNAGINSVNGGICNLGHRVDMGFCDVNRNVDAVRAENFRNTCEITNAIGASTQSIKDLINSNSMQDLRDRNVELANAYNNAQQTSAIINQLRPYPTPSYLTSPVAPFGAGYVPHHDYC